MESIKLKKIRVVKRDKTVVPFEPKKIFSAIEKAVVACGEGVESVGVVVSAVLKHIERNETSDRISVESIQNIVEKCLMASQWFGVAKAYILYRDHRNSERKPLKRVIYVQKGGQKVALKDSGAREMLADACKDLSDVSKDKVWEATEQTLYQDILWKDVQQALLLSTKVFVEQSIQYSFVASRLLLAIAKEEVLENLKIGQKNFDYESYFASYIEYGIKHKRLTKDFLKFDIQQLAQHLHFNNCKEKDLKFQYLGMQTLYDRYLLQNHGKRFELPQALFMRVAMALALAENSDREKWAIKFYEALSNFDLMCSTPTLFNAGIPNGQLSSCFLTTVQDKLSGIFDAIKENAMLSKHAGGLGNDWTNVRGRGAHIDSTHGKSQGVIPFLNVADATAVAVDQSGKRKGAACAYLETWHYDIEDFLELRKNTGDDRRRTHDMNTANWIPDLFMERVEEDAEWTLFCPRDVPDLHSLYGDKFREAYSAYEEKAKKNEIRHKTVKAVTLWRKMLSMLFETGHPWITFKDACNLRSPQKHFGTVHSSNLCTEITLNTSEVETAVCNLGSINLVNHMRMPPPTYLSEKKIDAVFDLKKLRETTDLAVRMLDNVIDINFYSVDKAKRSNLLHRPIGLGIMGLQDVFQESRTPFASMEAVDLSGDLMEFISYNAILKSADLAKEKGKYASFHGSTWSKGEVPFDTIKTSELQRPHLFQRKGGAFNWDIVRDRVKQGVRNSNILAIAPTVTISNICGVSSSIEPEYSNLFVKSNLSGEFTCVNRYLYDDLKSLGLWDAKMVQEIKYHNGSIQKIDRIPDSIKECYKTAFEISPYTLIHHAAERQKWIDQSQSLNLYVDKPSGRLLHNIYLTAWKQGIKTTYYLRTKAATAAEKSTIDTRELNAVKPVCNLDEGCEACQ